MNIDQQTPNIPTLITLTSHDNNLIRDLLSGVFDFEVQLVTIDKERNGVNRLLIYSS